MSQQHQADQYARYEVLQKFIEKLQTSIYDKKLINQLNTTNSVVNSTI